MSKENQLKASTTHLDKIWNLLKLFIPLHQVEKVEVQHRHNTDETIT